MEKKMKKIILFIFFILLIIFCATIARADGGAPKITERDGMDFIEIIDEGYISKADYERITKEKNEAISKLNKVQASYKKSIDEITAKYNAKLAEINAKAKPIKDEIKEQIIQETPNPWLTTEVISVGIGMFLIGAILL